MTISLFTTLLLSVWNQGYSQNTANIWYFGIGAGIDFNTQTPTSLANPSFLAPEGCSTICDENGDLLFYTNGTTVWNRNHDVMPNGTGLLGSTSSTQAALIVKKPNSNTSYYIFTTDAYSWPEGLRYSEVDLNLEGNLGDVTSIKNVFLTAPVSEKLAAIRHHNNSDYWIVTYDGANNDYLSYHFSATGVNPVPVISDDLNTGGPIVGSGSQGWISPSPNGNKLAVSHSNNANICEVFDFDPSCGQVSNGVVVFDTTAAGHQYGVEFSPNSRLLYLTYHHVTGTTIFQFNLQAGSEQAIIDSRQHIVTTIPRSYSLQLGPDNVIYNSHYDTSIVGAIYNPNVIGTGCNYVEDAIFLEPNTQCYTGLPNFPNDVNGFQVYNQCLGTPTSFDYYAQFADSLMWDFGEPSSGLNNTSNLSNPQHIYSDVGTYEVSLTVYRNGSLSMFQRSVQIITPPIVELGNDTLLCDGQLLLDAYSEQSCYLWQDSTTESNLLVEEEGSYWVSVSNSCQTVTDEIEIYYNEGDVYLGADTSLCFGDTLVLTASMTLSENLWQDGSMDTIQSITTEGEFWVNISNHCGVFGDTITVEITNPIILSLGADLEACMGDTVSIESSQLQAEILWDNQSNDATRNITESGVYWVRATNECMTASDTIEATFYPIPIVDVGIDTNACEGIPLILSIESADDTEYAWSTGSSSPSIIASVDGTYWITGTKNGCVGSDTVEVSFIDCSGELDMPNVFHPNGDGVNDRFIPRTFEHGYGAVLTIYDRWGRMVYSTEDILSGWDGASAEGSIASAGTYYWTIKYVNAYQTGKSSTGYVTLLR